jgi:hypothetical protein
MRRPLSFQPDGLRATPGLGAQLSGAQHRRGSVTSQYTHSRTASHPPLPHQPQQHFYSAPDIDLQSAANKSGLKAGERGYYFGFDTYPVRCGNASISATNVVVAGYEGGLAVYSVSKRGLDPLASLKGLKGGVFAARILPWLSSGDASDVHPFVAVVLHGPVLPESNDSGTTSARPSRPGSPRTDAPMRPNHVIEYYQTSVEVYSLQTNQRVAVLLQLPQVPIRSPIAITSNMFEPPPPSGSLSIIADEEMLVVASGVSGECWVYREALDDTTGEIKFGIAAKLWTTIQQSPRADPTEEGDRSGPPMPPQPAAKLPVIAINDRWLAYCPPSPSSRILLGAHVPVAAMGKATGVQSHTVPPPPSASVAVDLMTPGSMVNKILRETTQEVIQGAKWVGQQGIQAFYSYWNKGQGQPQQARSPPTTSQPWGASYPPRQAGPQFPPTHGTPGKAVTKDPGLVSLVHLDGLGHSSSVQHVATFSPPEGCSYLAFSPNGLALFTASAKGDVQDVWDLFRLQYTKSSALQVSAAGGSGARVRQIAHFTRMTVARIVHVAWTRPTGERIAMVTERGTVHLLDLPGTAFNWPPPRRRLDAQDPGGSSEPSSSAVSIASSAIGAAVGVARPLVNRSRRSSATSASNSTANTIVTSASHGGRVLAASIGSSIGKTAGSAIHQLRHTGENRVSLPPTKVLPGPNCVTWIAGRSHHALFAAAGGVVRTYPSKSRGTSNKVPRGYKDFNVPAIPDDIIPASVLRFINGDEDMYLSDREMDAGDTVTLEGRNKPKAPKWQGPDVWLPHAEIETSAPYQPFHTDKRVTLWDTSTPKAKVEADARARMPLGVTGAATQDVTSLLADIILEERASTPPISKKKKKQQQQQPPPAVATVALEAGTPPISQSPSATNLTAVSTTPVPSTSVTTGSKPWVFGRKIPATRLDLWHAPVEEEALGVSEDGRALPASAMERVLQVGANDEQIVITTRRRRGVRAEETDDGFFEDDCDVLDFADQRV